MSMNILQILKVISDIKLKEVTVTDKKGNASLKKVFECMLIACDKSIVKLVCWINAENVYNWLRYVRCIAIFVNSTVSFTVIKLN